MAVSIYDVAERAGLSIATVSRVLNHSGTVRPATEEKVHRAMEELGYSASYLAQSFAQKRSGLVGVIVSGLGSGAGSFNTECLQGISSVLEPEGYHLVILQSRPGVEQTALEGLKSGLLEGVIALLPDPIRQMAAAVREPGCPIGYIGLPTPNHACNVYAGYREYTLDIFRRLAEAGHSRVLFFTIEQSAVLMKSCLPDTVRTEDMILYSEAAQGEALARLLAQAAAEGFTAIHTDTALMAGRVLAALRLLDPPPAFSLTTVEHCAGEGELFAPGVDLCSIPAGEMAARLTAMVLRRIRGEIRPERETIQVEYVRNGSVHTI